MSQKFQVTGISCKSCLPHLRESLLTYADNIAVQDSPPSLHFTLKNGIEQSDVNFALARIDIKYGMEIVNQGKSNYYEKMKQWFSTYYPLLLIIAFIALVSTITTVQAVVPSTMLWMSSFMAGFFFVFSFFKLLDIKGFASAYATYDLLAKHCHKYGLIYPFIELGLGIAYLTGFAPTFTYIFTIIIMSFSSLGVIQVVMKKQKLKCACLGTSLNLPMSTLTIVEDLGMVLMAIIMLVMS